MVYDPNTPESANEAPDVSQTKITANFQAIKTFFEENHTTINDPGQGKHKFLTMPKQDPAPTPAGGEMALYVKQPDSSVNKLFLFLKDQDGTEKQVLPKETAQTNGKLVMPGGLTLLWGEKDNVPQLRGVCTIPFHTPFKHTTFLVTFSVAHYIGTSSAPHPGAFLVASWDKNQFQVKPSPATLSAKFHYFAIGN